MSLVLDAGLPDMDPIVDSTTGETSVPQDSAVDTSPQQQDGCDCNSTQSRGHVPILLILLIIAAPRFRRVLGHQRAKPSGL